MFLLDSLMISGLKWVMNTVITSAEAEMNDDTALREQLLAAEMQREMGEISDEDFAEVEADLLARIREIKQRREGGSGPLSMGEQPLETTGDNTIQIEASVSGDFHDPGDRPHTTIIEDNPPEGALLNLVQTEEDQQTRVLDMVPDEPTPAPRRPRKTPRLRSGQAPARRAPAAKSRTRSKLRP
jgi:hypothetical protein